MQLQAGTVRGLSKWIMKEKWNLIVRNTVRSCQEDGSPKAKVQRLENMRHGQETAVISFDNT